MIIDFPHIQLVLGPPPKTLRLNPQVFCVATSRIILSDRRAVDAVESGGVGGVGIAQLFKHFRRHGEDMP